VERDQRITIRVSREEKTILEEAAWRRRLDLSAWIRHVMLLEARKRPSAESR